MAGTLYLVPTPIGNLGDISKRMADTLAQVDFVAAEDTRVSLKLLNHLDIKKPMLSYHRHNTQTGGPQVLARLRAGENGALVTDAGMPAISDPGEVIVTDALAEGIKVVPVPAASACVTALAVSGQATGRFVFEGFLPTNLRQRRERLEQLKGEERTVIFYEAPHKLRMTLGHLREAFGPDRSITLARELTKLHEEVVKTTLGEAVEYYEANNPRGEYVLVMAGASPAETQPAPPTLDEAAQKARELMEGGMSASAAAKQAAQNTPFSKSQIYRLLTRQEENE